MYYKNICFHNVNYMPKEQDDSYSLSRLPAENLNDLNNNEAFITSGVELRFKMISNKVSITLKCNPNEYGDVKVYFGSYFAGSEFTKTITHSGITITVSKHNITQDFFDKERSYTAPFSSEVVRIVLPSVHTRFVSVSGKTRIPSPQETPKTTILFFGGSVIQSKNVVPDTSLPFMLAAKLNADYLNMGLTNSSTHSENTAKFIAANRFDVAVIECADEPFNESEFSNYLKHFKNFVKYLSRNKKRKLLFIDRFYADYYEKQSHYKKQLKSINSVTQKHINVNIFDEVDFNDLTPSRNEYTPTAMFDVYKMLLKKLDRVVLPYTVKDKKAAKHPTLYAEMPDDQAPINSPQILTQKLYLEEQKQLNKEKHSIENNSEAE